MRSVWTDRLETLSLAIGLMSLGIAFGGATRSVLADVDARKATERLTEARHVFDEALARAQQPKATAAHPPEPPVPPPAEPPEAPPLEQAKPEPPSEEEEIVRPRTRNEGERKKPGDRKPSELKPIESRTGALLDTKRNEPGETKSPPKPPKPERSAPPEPAGPMPGKLVSAGIDARDVRMAGHSELLEAWRRAGAAERPDLEAKLDRELLQDGFLSKLFDEAAALLDKRAGDPAVASLESEYLDLRTARRPNLDETARRALRRRLLKLRSDLR